MNTSLTIWRMQLRSLRNAVRYDTRMRVALTVGLAFSAIIGLWSASQLSLLLQRWQAQGPLALNTGLWSLCLLTWSSMAGFTLLGCVQRALGDDETLLLFTLPLAPAARFRALYGSFFIEHLWNFLLLELGVTGYILAAVLGWRALTWLVLLQLGVAVAVLCTLLLVFLVIRYLIPRERRKKHIGVAALFLLTVVLVSLLSLKGAFDLSTFKLWLRPEFVIVLFILSLAIVLGPLTQSAGRLYVAAFSITQSWNRPRNAATLPGIHTLTRLFARRRTLSSALFVKMLLSQSRSFVAWGRIGMVLIVLFLFPQLYTLAAHAGWSNTLFVAIFAAGLALLGIAEQAPNGISGEANRLSLYLTAPFNLSQFLRAKLFVYLLPMLIQGLTVALFLAWRLALTPGQAALSLVIMALLILSALAIFVWGSAWDEDLNLTVEGTMQTILHEETPITPRRILLLNSGLLSFAATLLLLLKLPPLLALPALIVFDATIIVAMWRFGLAQLRNLMQRG